MTDVCQGNESCEMILQRDLNRLWTRTDQLFAVLFVIQLLGAIVTALILSPMTWQGSESSLHVHLLAALLVGVPMTVAPIAMTFLRPGSTLTRMTISVCQAVFSGLLIHLSGGRIETHFHIFGSLAFLAFYRDWRVLMPYTVIIAADHLARGVFWPESIYGVMVSSPWRTLEHALWVVFEDVFLVWSCVTGRRELERSASAETELTRAQHATEQEVLNRTRELEKRTLELEESAQEGRVMSQQLAQAQKLESIGQLAAGIAHEINTPMQFINDNTEYVKDCMTELFSIVDLYQEMLDPESQKVSWKERNEAIQRSLDECDFESLREEIPVAIAENVEGINRVVNIVRSMKEFSHPGTTEKTLTDLNQAIRSTATISRNRWKYVAELDLDLAPDLPMINVLPAEINQALLNLIVNSADALGEMLGENPENLGRITVRTSVDGNHVLIDVSDDGPGIPTEVINRVFDPFFTTKQVGKGTGQGLSICHNVVVTQHDGAIDVQSTPGQGARFLIRLPLNDPAHSNTPSEPDTAFATA